MKNKNFKQTNKKEGYISADPIPSVQELAQYYSEKYYQAPQSTSYQLDYPPIEYDYKRLKFNAILHAVKQKGILGGKFLDIGAGEGFFMKAAFEHGYDVNGIDFSNYGIRKFHSELASKLHAGDSFEVMDTFASREEQFDLCCAVNVLEHVIDPNVFLEKIKVLMKPEGILSITVPNDFSAIQKLLLKDDYIDREFWFAPPDHLHYFNTQNLIPFLESRGFVSIDAFSDFPIDMYLLHSGSNYVINSQNGPAAHKARMTLDLLIAQNGLEKYLNYYRAMFQVGLGRDITVLLKIANR